MSWTVACAAVAGPLLVNDTTTGCPGRRTTGVSCQRRTGGVVVGAADAAATDVVVVVTASVVTVASSTAAMAWARGARAAARHRTQEHEAMVEG